MTPGVKYSALITDHFLQPFNFKLQSGILPPLLSQGLMSSVEVVMVHCSCGLLPAILLHQWGHGLSPTTSYILSYEQQPQKFKHNSPSPLCPGCDDEGGLLQVGVELAVALALGPQLHAELDGQTPGQKPSCADATSSPPLRSFQSNTRQTCTKMIKVSTSGKENSRIRIRCPFLSRRNSGF